MKQNLEVVILQTFEAILIQIKALELLCIATTPEAKGLSEILRGILFHAASSLVFFFCFFSEYLSET